MKIELQRISKILYLILISLSFLIKNPIDAAGLNLERPIELKEQTTPKLRQLNILPFKFIPALDVQGFTEALLEQAQENGTPISQRNNTEIEVTINNLESGTISFHHKKDNQGFSTQALITERISTMDGTPRPGEYVITFNPQLETTNQTFESLLSLCSQVPQTSYALCILTLPEGIISSSRDFKSMFAKWALQKYGLTIIFETPSIRIGITGGGAENTMYRIIKNNYNRSIIDILPSDNIIQETAREKSFTYTFNSKAPQAQKILNAVLDRIVNHYTLGCLQ